MPAKKEEIDCTVECAALKKEVAALKKEIAALKKEIEAKSSGEADPRVDLLVEWIQVAQLPTKHGGPEKRAKIFKSLGIK